jgi:signal transduction histidine kinase
VLTIEDDGVGFDPRGHSGGNGLRNMRERAVTLRGTIQVTSSAGTGTKLRVTFPIEAGGPNGPLQAGPRTVRSRGTG